MCGKGTLKDWPWPTPQKANEIKLQGRKDGAWVEEGEKVGAAETSDQFCSEGDFYKLSLRNQLSTGKKYISWLAYLAAGHQITKTSSYWSKGKISHE